MSTVSPSSQLVQVVPDSHNNTGDSSAKVKYEDVVRKPRCQPQETMGTPPSGMPPASQRPAKKKARVTTVVDPRKPKCYKSGYNFFFPELYAWLKPEYHGKEMIITKMISPMWGNLYESEKQVYQDKGVKDVERYITEMLEYKSAHEGGASASAAAAIVAQ
ncbi:hypothetical protein Bca101_084182 [Brassica carinata]